MLMHPLRRYPLYNAFIPYIIATKGAAFGDGSTYLTYRNSLIIAVLGVPGAILGGVMVEIPKYVVHPKDWICINAVLDLVVVAL